MGERLRREARNWQRKTSRLLNRLKHLKMTVKTILMTSLNPEVLDKLLNKLPMLYQKQFLKLIKGVTRKNLVLQVQMMTMRKILILGKEKKVRRNTRLRKDKVVMNLLRGETKTM